VDQSALAVTRYEPAQFTGRKRPGLAQVQGSGWGSYHWFAAICGQLRAEAQGRVEGYSSPIAPLRWGRELPGRPRPPGPLDACRPLV